MRSWLAFRRASLHTLAALLATCLVWVIWSAWFVFIQGNYDAQSGGAGGTFAFALKIGVTVSFILAGVFLLLSFLYHYKAGKFTARQYTLSALTLAIPSLLLLSVLPEGGPPLIAALIGLPVLSTLWLVGGQETPGQADPEN
jgi:hypothetical protein